jgi:hypothetical protein
VCRWGAAAREDRHFAREEEGVEQETTYVKLNIGAPMSQGVVEVKQPGLMVRGSPAATGYRPTRQTRGLYKGGSTS